MPILSLLPRTATILACGLIMIATAQDQPPDSAEQNAPAPEVTASDTVAADAPAPDSAAPGSAVDDGTSAFQRMLDSLGLTENDLEAKVRSTLLFGGSSPVSFSGEGKLKLQYHEFSKYPMFARLDRSWLQSNWEGNESLIRLGMVVRAGRNTVLWSKIGFQHTLPGNYLGPVAGDTLVASRHDKGGEAATIHEDMSAGFALRTVPASFWLKMGAVHWIEASPFTVWKSQPRTFAWEYLPYEIEQPIARYFEYNLARGEKTGRAAWNKKPFNGINFESINLPFNLYTNFLYGACERFDNFERELVDFSNDLTYANLRTAAKGRGVGDTYRHVVHARVAANEALGRLTPGVNYVGIDYSPDIINATVFQNTFDLSKSGREAFYKEPKVYSVDLRGPLSDKLSFHADLGMNLIDSTLFLFDSVGADAVTGKAVLERRDLTTSSSPVTAAYTRITSKYGVPVTADLAFIPRGFYSPFSFAVPADAFFPFGANMLGPGKFLARGEGSPYSQNMAGVNLAVAPELPGYGHLRLIYGQHMQLTEAQDVIYFPYRLNGQDFFSSFHTSYNRWGNDPIDVSIATTTWPYRYEKRLGDESFTRPNTFNSPPGPEAGGLRTDYLGSFESFVPYQSLADADSNLHDTSTIFTRSPFVPVHKKYTFNLEVDAAYDIAPLVRYGRDLFVGVYAAINGVSTTMKPAALGAEADDMLLWGAYIRFEPAMALSNSFYLVGIAGFENWRSEKAYMVNPATRTRTFREAMHAPLDYRDYALGLGFDWDMLARVGLHGRAKWMLHEDVNFPDNDWETPVVSMEIKTWF